MKSGTTELLKFVKLQRRLGESRRGIIGLLEGLWLSTAKNCPSGDIGRFTNEEIAIMVDWAGDPDELVAVLAECRWLDTCDTYRLVVHDWHEHCPQYVKGNIKKYGRELITQATRKAPEAASQSPSESPNNSSQPPRDTPKEPPKDTPIQPPSKPSLAKPNQTKPDQTNTHTHTPPKVPQELSECWRRWQGYVLERYGRSIQSIEAETVLMDLLRRGQEKASRDIEFSIAKGAKSILDSDNDFEKQRASKGGLQKPRPPKAEGAVV